MKEIELFRPQKKMILDFVISKGVDKISTYSASTSIPLIVIYTYILEDLSEYKELAENKIKELKYFYDIKE